MTNREHLMENAIYAVAKDMTFYEFVENEKLWHPDTAIKELTNNEVGLIWDMANYVVHTLYGGCINFWEANGLKAESDSQDTLGYKRLTLYGVDLETPTSCAECPVWSYCYEIHAKRNGMLPKDKRLEYCPIVEG